MVPLIPIGYFPKDTAVPSGWTDCDSVAEICSVSTCIASGPEGWIEHWLHNEFGYFNSESDAMAACGDEAASFHPLAFCMLPTMFKDGVQVEFNIPDFHVSALPSHYVRLGFDVSNAMPGFNVIPFLNCSPLSCNGMAKEIPVNEFCLLDSLKSAVELATKLSVEGAEPGPYFVVEVLRGGSSPPSH